MVTQEIQIIASTQLLVMNPKHMLFSVGKIPDLLPEGSVDGDTKMVLVNAVYFKGKWKTPFEKKLNGLYPFRVNAVWDKMDFPSMYFRILAKTEKEKLDTTHAPVWLVSNKLCTLDSWTLSSYWVSLSNFLRDHMHNSEDHGLYNYLILDAVVGSTTKVLLVTIYDLIYLLGIPFFNQLKLGYC